MKSIPAGGGWVRLTQAYSKIYSNNTPDQWVHNHTFFSVYRNEVIFYFGLEITPIEWGFSRPGPHMK